ncbi:MAG TPA: ATP-binding cassette domain-containing protein, partial [Micromonospora sp.]
YGDDLPWVLRGVTLDIPAGSSVALVGTNGAGKSTLVKLLCGLYRPTRGRITWDGRDLADCDPALLRDRIGAVFQDFMAYELTAHENIAIGSVRDAGDRARTVTAARLAGIDDDLRRLPRGYATLLSRLLHRSPVDPDGEPGVVLSGGQWQRVALARMLMRHDRDLLILDEPTAGLDAHAEHRIHEVVRTAMVGRARLLISHRLSAVRHADRIHVLDGGHVTECGDHHELLSGGGTYAELFRVQASGYLDPETAGR